MVSPFARPPIPPIPLSLSSPSPLSQWHHKTQGSSANHRPHTQAQTPSQRKANLKFAAKNEGKMGKPEAAIKKKENFKSPISPFWLGEFGPSFTAGLGRGGEVLSR